MKSGTRNVIIVAACAVLLGGTAFALTRTGTGSSSSSSASSAAGIQLISKSSENVVSMKVTNKKGSYTLVPMKASAATASSGSSSAASSSSVDYTVEELGGCPVDTSATSTVVQNGFSLSATKNVGTVSDLSQYGLTNPQATVEVKFKDGSTFSYKIGSATATDASAYYMSGTDSRNVYVVNVDSGLLENANYFVKKEMLALSNSSGSTATGSSSSGVDFTQITLTGSNFPKNVVLQKSGEGLAIISPDSYAVDSTNLSSLETCLTSLSAESVAAVNPDAAALKKYGLSNPTAAAEFTADKKNYKLIIGAKSGKDYYAMIDGVNVVYSVSADNVNGLVSQNLFTMRSKLVNIPSVDTVKSISVTTGSTTNVINVTRTENTASSTQDKKAYNYKVTGNGGKALDYENNYKRMYEKLIGISVYSDADKKPSGSPAVTIKYSYFDKAGADTIELYQTDARHYTILLNGKVYGLGVKSDIDSVMQFLTQFENGQTIPQS